MEGGPGRGQCLQPTKTAGVALAGQKEEPWTEAVEGAGALEAGTSRAGSREAQQECSSRWAALTLGS